MRCDAGHWRAAAVTFGEDVVCYLWVDLDDEVEVAERVGEGGWGVGPPDLLSLFIVAEDADVLPDGQLERLPRVLESEAEELCVVAHVLHVNQREGGEPGGVRYCQFSV